MNEYRREIALVVIVKLMLIILLKQAFFAQPVSTTLDSETVSAAIIGSTSNALR